MPRIEPVIYQPVRSRTVLLIEHPDKRSQLEKNKWRIIGGLTGACLCSSFLPLGMKICGFCGPHGIIKGSCAAIWEKKLASSWINWLTGWTFHHCQSYGAKHVLPVTPESICSLSGLGAGVGAASVDIRKTKQEIYANGLKKYALPIHIYEGNSIDLCVNLGLVRFQFRWSKHSIFKKGIPWHATAIIFMLNLLN